MKKLFIALVCVSVFVMVGSCGKSKADLVVDGFEDLVEEVESKKGEMTVEEWAKIQEDFNKRFEELGIDKIDEKEFSTMQKMKILSLTLRWGAAMAESSSTLIETAVEQAEKEAPEE